MSSARLGARRMPLSLRPIGEPRGFPMSTIAAGGLVSLPGAFCGPSLAEAEEGRDRDSAGDVCGAVGRPFRRLARRQNALRLPKPAS